MRSTRNGSDAIRKDAYKRLCDESITTSPPASIPSGSASFRMTVLFAGECRWVLGHSSGRQQLPSSV